MDRLIPLNTALLTTLLPFTKNQKIADMLGQAIGSGWDNLGDADSWPILAFYVQAQDDVFSVYLATPGRFILAELTLAGRTRIVTLPIERLARLVTDQNDTSLSVLIELDADGIIYRDIPDGNNQSTKRSFPPAFEISASGEQISPLLNFSVALRSCFGL